MRRLIAQIKNVQGRDYTPVSHGSICTGEQGTSGRDKELRMVEEVEGIGEEEKSWE